MALWHVRLGPTNRKFLKDYEYREDLAINHSIVMIGYELTVDVRGKDYSALWTQVESDMISKYPNTSKRSITMSTNLVKRFRDDINANDYVISPYYNNPNNNKVSVGQFVGGIEILENLVSSKGGINSFAQKYPMQSANIIKFGKMLARKVVWNNNLISGQIVFDKYRLCPLILNQITGQGHITRPAIVELDQPQNMPRGLLA